MLYCVLVITNCASGHGTLGAWVCASGRGDAVSGPARLHSVFTEPRGHCDLAVEGQQVLLNRVDTCPHPRD
jgi:hypothetical protein